jgi:hypothetical protein
MAPITGAVAVLTLSLSLYMYMCIMSLCNGIESWQLLKTSSRSKLLFERQGSLHSMLQSIAS